MEKYKKSFINLLKTPVFIIPLIIVAIGSYGFLLSHSAVNVDTLSANRYYDEGLFISQQRVVGILVDKIFNIMDFRPFLGDFIAVLLLMIASGLYCSLFDNISKNKIKTIAFTVFSCFFISYPLIMEIFTYSPIGICISLGFCFTAISLMLMEEFLNLKKKRFFVLSSIFLCGAISIYESFVLVYIMGVFASILIKILFANEKKLTMKENILIGIKYLISLILVIIVYYIIANLTIWIFKAPKDLYSNKKIYYSMMEPLKAVKNLIYTVVVNYFINGFSYLPITFLVISSIISIVIGLVFAIKRKDDSIWLMILGMNFTLILLSIIQGKAAQYRTCQQFQLFVSIIFMLLTQFVIASNTKKYMKNIIVFIMFLMIFYQVKDIYKWQYLNDLRYQKEKNDMIAIGNELVKNYGVENKPIVFTRKI